MPRRDVLGTTGPAGASSTESSLVWRRSCVLAAWGHLWGCLQHGRRVGWRAGSGISMHENIRETGPRPQIGVPPRSAFRSGGPLGLRGVSQWSRRQAPMACGGREARRALYSCGPDLLLRPAVLRRAAARHERARSRRNGSVGTRSLCPRPPKLQARRHSGQRTGAPEMRQSEPPAPEPKV